MNKTPALYSLVLCCLALLPGCGGEAAHNPIEPGGETPALLATIPDGEYLAVGYIDIDRLVGSEIGKEVLKRYALLNMLMAAQGIDLGKSFHEVALAVGFEGRAWPNFIKALPVIVLLRADIKPELVISALGGGEVEIFQLSGHEVRRIQLDVPGLGGAAGGAAFLTFPQAGLTVLSTSQELLKRYLERQAGGEGIGGLKSASMLARADKRAEGWMVLRQSEESRDLVMFLAGFDDCIISLKAAEALEIVCVMDFSSAEAAEESIKYYDFTRRQLERFKEKAERDEDYKKLADDASLNFMLAFTTERSADLAIYSARFHKEWFTKFGNINLRQPTAEQR
jgi:hypothetical protein